MLRSLTSFFWKSPSNSDDGQEKEVLFQLQNCHLDDGKSCTLSLCKESNFTYALQIADLSIPITEDLQIEIDSMNKLIDLPAQKLAISLSSSCNKPTLDTFKYLLAQALYESAQGKPHTEASDAELEALVDGFVASGAAKSQDQKIDLGKEVFRASDLSFYEYDPTSKTFKLFSPASQLNVTAVLHQIAPFQYVMHIGSHPKGRLFSQRLDPEVNEHVDKGTLSFVWCHHSSTSASQVSGKGTRTFCLKFPTSKALGDFATKFGQCIWEIANEETWERISAADSSFLLARYQPMDVDEEESSSSSSEEDSSDNDYDHDQETNSHSFVKDGDDSNEEDSKQTNRLLAIGYRDRSFVSRGSSIGVFKDDSGSFDFVTTIKDVKTLSGESLHADQLMLHDQDSTLLLRSNTADSSKIYKMDLNRGKVVDEWHVDSASRPIRSIVPSSKAAQETPEQTLIGISQNSLYRLDPRLPGKEKAVEGEGKAYAGKTLFSCGTTTSSGALAVASEKGEIRLFDQLDKRAKSLIPGFGDAILGVDTLPSGKFILATCKTYLLLIDTSLEGESKNAFYKSSTAKRKPPIRLSLRPEHVAFLGALSFTPAHFSTNPNVAEDAAGGVFIVTSTGPYVVMWPLERVLKGKLFDYQIRKYSERVVADNFRYGQHDSIVVALPHDIHVAPKETLKSVK